MLLHNDNINYNMLNFSKYENLLFFFYLAFVTRSLSHFLLVKHIFVLILEILFWLFKYRNFSFSQKNCHQNMKLKIFQENNICEKQYTTLKKYLVSCKLSVNSKSQT